MHSLFPLLLPLLPSFGFAMPAQSISSLGLNTTSPGSSNPIGPEPIDPRFNMTILYQAVNLAEDPFLVVAVQFLGILCASPFNSKQPTSSYWDDYLPFVDITHRSPLEGGTIEVRFLVWGIYSGMKDMIETRRFKDAQIVLRWDREIVGTILIKKRPFPPPLLSGTRNFTDVLQRRASSSDQLNLVSTESLDGTSFELSIPASPSNPESYIDFRCEPLESLSKYGIIMALMDAMLAVAPRTTRARLQEPVQVRPAAPYDARLVVLPVHSEEPFMTYGLVAAQ